MNSLKKIYVNISLFDIFASNFYDNLGSILFHLFRKIILLCSSNIEHTAIFNDRKKTWWSSISGKVGIKLIKYFFKVKINMMLIDIIGQKLFPTKYNGYTSNMLRATKKITLLNNPPSKVSWHKFCKWFLCLWLCLIMNIMTLAPNLLVFVSSVIIAGNMWV